MATLRAVVDRLLVALAMLLGVYLPDGTSTVTAAILVGMAVLDGWLRWRERGAVREVVRCAGLPECEATLELLRRAGVPPKSATRPP